MSMETLQADIITLHAMEEEEKRVATRLAKLKTDARLVELRIMQEFSEMGINTLGHAGVLARVKHTTQYNAKDWTLIYRRILETQEFDLLHKRLSSTAVRERFKNSDPIAGVEPVEVPSLVLTLQGGE